MPLTLQWYEIALRLLLTIFAGAVVGINRGEHGRPAGLRTTMLVCLAAAVAMIQTNLLLGTAGRPPNSFIMLDLMRLPLGILSGMGFIGGGAILKRDNMTLGVTTAATLWFVTVLGLCFGGGQLLLGLVALALGMMVLETLHRFELRLRQDRRATLVLTVAANGPPEAQLRQGILGAGYRIISLGMTCDAAEQRQEYSYEVSWRARPTEIEQPTLIGKLAQVPGVSRLQWRPQGLPAGLG